MVKVQWIENTITDRESENIALEPEATAEAITETEQTTGFSFPADFVEL